MTANSIEQVLTAEQALQVKSAAIASSINAIALSDLEGRLFYVNPAFLHMWRCEEWDVLGRPATEFWCYPQQASGIIDTLHAQGEWNGEITARRRDGSTFEAQISGSLVRNPNGQPLCLMGIFLDVTPTRTSEEALRRYAHELGERAKELNMLYEISAHFEDVETTIAESLASIVAVLPSGWQYPDDACAQLVVGGETYATANYRPTLWQLVSHLLVGGEDLGTITVGYLSEHPACDDGLFLSEERRLIDEVARRIGRFIQRKQALAALQESEERFRSTFEQAAVGLAQVSLDGHFLRVNQKLCTILGYAPEELMRLTFQEITYAGDLEVDLEYVRQTLAGERSNYAMEKRYYRGDGSIVWADLTVALTHDGAGRPKYFVSVVEDISQRRLAEEALTRSEARYRDLFENSPVALFEQDFSAVKRRLESLEADDRLDPRAYFETHPEVVAECISLVKILTLNHASLKLYGAATKEELLVGLDRLVPPEAYQLFVEELIWIAEGRTGFTWEGVNRKLSGERIWIRLYWLAAPFSEDTLASVLVSIEDISARKRAEAALLASEARYRAVSELTSDFMYTVRVNQEGSMEVEWITDAFTRITGHIVDKAHGGTEWLLWVHPDDRNKVAEALERLLAGLPAVVELRLQTARGETRWLRVHSRPELDAASGRVVRFRGAGQDITDYKRIEQEMIHSERLAVMGQTVATLAHEIKNPLQAIQNSLDLLADFPLLPDERDETLQICRREMMRLIQITQNVLGLSRNDFHIQQLVTLAAVWDHTLELLDQQIREASVLLDHDVPASLPPVHGVQEQLVQVMLNLTLNAVESTPRSGHIAVYGHRQGDQVVITVANDGPTIPPEHLERLFDPFFTTKPNGTGLGLFVCHTIVRQHNGALTAANLPDGSGVRFTVVLPIAAKSEGI